MKLNGYLFRYLMVSAAVACCLSSCKLGQKYVSPEIDLPQELYEGVPGSLALSDDTITVADLSWWEVYSDTALHALIARTLEHNKDLLMARARIQELAALKRVSTSQLFPQVGGEAYAQKEGLNY